jgi:uncharacterized cupredoxin-like copper-binding protein
MTNSRRIGVAIAAAAALAIVGSATLVVGANGDAGGRSIGTSSVHRAGMMGTRQGNGMMSGATASCAPATPPGTTVHVRLANMGGAMMGSAGMMGRGTTAPAGMMRIATDRVSVPAGQVSLVAANAGSMTHELVILPLAAGQAVGTRAIGADNRVSETGSLGEASRSCGAGAGDGIVAGSSGRVTIQLRPGRYELVCNIAGHYRSGMYTELDVE